jgi:hypothetical protein
LESDLFLFFWGKNGTGTMATPNIQFEAVELTSYPSIPNRVYN